ncbi:DUF1906 domain-containing protein [Gordonia sp. X0973]|uniref:DUF1906 domain-containing protein n=1 Tax=Gordonia sp. X0973 TaxID=2742602 RepID=UPI000F53B444|nr:DUF1906 domain-containing protein [Gordonia sp. X0973]QKT07829.1 DUF1906 domain-containing protein [Gordonia sp. X0973]
MDLNRRSFLTTAAGAGAAVCLGAATAHADGSDSGSFGSSSGSANFGALCDYSAAVPPATAIRAAGYLGAIRYVSGRLPADRWMKAKPITAAEAKNLRRAGLTIVSCYQYAKNDWIGGFQAGVHHARIGAAKHRAAGGPPNAPIYASIDANPSFDQFLKQIAPYLRGWQSVIGPGRTGVYGNAQTLTWAMAGGLASWYWQHDWGTPRGLVHPLAHIHQLPGERRIAGIGIDRNIILQPNYGQW